MDWQGHGDARPDPDELLARVREEEEQAARGKLTIFFGAAPGVGKTYTMLEAARLEAEDQKRDVVVGFVETHGRYDTGSLLIGLELLPRRDVEHRGIKLEEFDLDAALARRPQLLLVDELAHTNAPGSRHLKRWQDVEELLDAGIDVFTTLNVQHLESLNDVVAQITGVIVRETVPDAVFDTAYEVRLVDLPVDELLERLREGKVYVPDTGGARDRELLPRRATSSRCASWRCAARPSASTRKMRGYKAAHGIEETWHTGERVLVCVSPSPHSARLVRAARRMADEPARGARRALRRDARVAPHVGRRPRAPRAEHAPGRVARAASPSTCAARTRAIETVRYARKRNVTKIVVGKPTHPRWRDVFKAVVPRRHRPPEPTRSTSTSSPGCPGRPRRPRAGREDAHAPTSRSRATSPRSSSSPRPPLIGWYVFGAIAARRRRHGVPARRRHRVDALRVRPVAARGRAERRSRSTSSSSRRYFSFAVTDLQPHRDVRGDVRRRGRHQPPDEAHPRPGRQRARGASGARRASTR